MNNDATVCASVGDFPAEGLLSIHRTVNGEVTEWVPVAELDGLI